MSVVRWGILGPGNVAKAFAEDMRLEDSAELVAVGSRSLERAKAFAEKFGVARAHGSYEALAADPDVDVIYVSSPHTVHADHMRLCLEAAKHVLCEKPFTINAGEAEPVIALARERGLFMMEALTPRHMPAARELMARIDAGAIGKVTMAVADLGKYAPFDAQDGMYNPEVGGGTLLCNAVYPLSLVCMVLGPPVEANGMCEICPSGVDDQVTISLRHKNGGLSSVFSTLHSETPCRMFIYGTEGSIEAGPRTSRLNSFTIFDLRGDVVEKVERRTDGIGFVEQVRVVGECLRAGKTESPTFPLDDTLAIMRAMDSLRANWGIRYPSEE